MQLSTLVPAGQLPTQSKPSVKEVEIKSKENSYQTSSNTCLINEHDEELQNVSTFIPLAVRKVQN